MLKMCAVMTTSKQHHCWHFFQLFPNGKLVSSQSNARFCWITDKIQNCCPLWFCIFQVLFDKLKLDSLLPQAQKIAKTVSGNLLSTSECVLKQLKYLHPLPSIILDYRQVLQITFDEETSCICLGNFIANLRILKCFLTQEAPNLSNYTLSVFLLDWCKLQAPMSSGPLQIYILVMELKPSFHCLM
jgi:hypothetical protein